MSDHFDGKRFFNPGQPSTDRKLADLLRWRFQGTRSVWPPAPPPRPTVMPPISSDAARVTFIGHASVLIQVSGLNILIDPVWSDRASPVRFAGPRRWNAPGVAFEDLPPIHAVLLTHSHYDHMDAPTLARLLAHAARLRHHPPRLIAALGNDRVLTRAVPGCNVETGDWGERLDLSDQVAVTIHPAYHWSARTPFDRRRALWCGFVLQTRSGSIDHAPIYHAGDTGYGDGRPFRLVAEQFGPPALAILPIGAYEPRWFMKDQHANPAEAVRILQDCQAKQALGIHWGTFNLTDEPRDAPPRALKEACRDQSIEPGRFNAAQAGDIWQAP